MPDMELNTSTPETSTNINTETVESADRRSFIKGTVMVAGAAAAGHLAASSAEAAATPASEPLQGGVAAIARPPVAELNIHFDRRKQITVADIQRILPEIFQRTGCFTCGLVGLDLRIGLNDVLPVLQDGVTLSLEGQIGR